MLVLSRAINEAVAINEAIQVTVLEVCGSRVRLGIAAPRHVSVHRCELPRGSGHRRATVDCDDRQSSSQMKEPSWS